MKPKPTTPAAVVKLTRCAIYTRKSSEEGLAQEFNSLDAQREAGELFVRSQGGEGWTVLPDRYDDGGFTGGNTDRPGLQRLMKDIAAGRVGVVIVYKVDRLSRSLLDFAALMQTFEAHQVGFVSVTQQFCTTTSMGRLVLNVLLSFAQFERELVSERTRDKIAATRRKGKWTGGRPVLGYTVDPDRFKLVVDPAEADRVRAIFQLYLTEGSLLPVVEELARRGWQNKAWTSRKGLVLGGKAFTRTSLYKLLTNVVYAGKVRYKAEVHPGEHAAIVDPGVWQRVQSQLAHNGRGGGGDTAARNRFGAVLKGLLQCVPCGCAMTPTHSTRGAKRYRYYVCSAAQKKGWRTCPSKAVPAEQTERFVVDQVRAVGRDPALVAGVLAEARAQDETRAADLTREERGLTTDLTSWHKELRALSGQLRPGADNGPVIARLADLQERVGSAEARAAALRRQVVEARSRVVGEDEAAAALSAFDPVWGTLSPREQGRVLALLIERIGYDGGTGKVAITFRAAGIQTLARELADKREEKRA
ncbi:recombinase family protein [Limnoglobus roseus]|uniref:Recombinase family protein n=1 Tax=Limnoglobus roseus TaxID=2598579 RepID=A0A5C1ARN2_9BACT|nr:recombinase family protein [Limnoglobus roseus]QEL20676.1 recombinase family protein [Limnoglobus roseus]